MLYKTLVKSHSRETDSLLIIGTWVTMYTGCLSPSITLLLYKIDIFFYYSEYRIKLKRDVKICRADIIASIFLTIRLMNFEYLCIVCSKGESSTRIILKRIYYDDVQDENRRRGECPRLTARVRFIRM